ncbi:Uncharacterized conserved protein, DUF1330 family [Tenacibaculum sp. MAR_2009_124]|uniref:DUF1330 domain-containing protein n=1 Tax=Tenacibaculum sp. MAR_2009_124 TaxID=1250059 RepID=UPI00089BDFC5|nr:DUF1330 domain-containing protein [Tenacibaculum sp. MAR_2009_124]SED05742.1 Uncharacterized conserved protein, DUF1330 family [Tenacibaculum sp. MAR_2009_124]
MEKTYLTIVATINPKGKEELSKYLEKTEILYKKVNAKPVHKFMITKTLIGESTPNLVSIMEFQNIHSLNDVFESDDYKELIPYREKAFTKLEAFISQ